MEPRTERRLMHTDKTYSTSLKDPVKIQPIELHVYPPRSVPYMFEKACKHYSNKIAMLYKADGEWAKITFREYKIMVRKCAKSFMSLGLQPNTVVCIIGFNSPEWFVSDLAAIYAGGVAAGIYTTNSPESCLHIINHSSAKIIVAENTQIEKIMKIRSRAPTLKAVVQYGGDHATQPGVIHWKDFLKLGDQVSDETLDAAKKAVNVNQCCTLVYTSGTTGAPKGAMLSHDNILYDALKIGEKIALAPNEVYVSYLPLSHVAGNVVDIHCGYLHGVKIYFADKDALRGSLISTFQDVKPTRILSVPRVWEKIYEKFQEKASEVTGLKKLLSQWAKRQGLKKNEALENQEVGAMYPLMYHLANMLVFRKVKKILGIEHCKTIISGAAPLSKDIKEYFSSLDILILEAYGMSESSALHCCCTTDRFKLDSCGTTCTGMISYIHKEEADGSGELCMYGRHVFMGYLNDKERTLEALDDRGYLHSGDLAYIDDDGFIHITGRLKEIIITAGGENVAPLIIEQHIKAALPCIGYAVVIGDRRKFLVVLLTFATEVDKEGKSTDTLTSTVQRWLNSLSVEYTKLSELMQSGPNKKVLDAIQAGIDKANEQAISNAQKVQKFAIIPQDFSIDTGEIGPTMKLKRQFIAEKYEEIINDLYERTEHRF